MKVINFNLFKMINKTLKTCIIILVFQLYFFSSPNLYSSNSQDTLLLDPKIRHGKLPNGLTYYIKPINDSSSKIDIRLFVKAGSSVLIQTNMKLNIF